ncbi:hypothetical protein C4D60_Mb06t01780 [Musa balbisiana]|uniref:C3H1-type domain-containing protein n=1 Tax=Musa balbisiana TaxID=52838 RepID=A0A4S8IMC0_MUSBA|nr:hypothetical protein C4D60_Mb06t01780 [Musa balbisiana]
MQSKELAFELIGTVADATLTGAAEQKYDISKKQGAEVSFFQSRAIIHQFNEFCVKDVRDDNLDNNCPSRSQNKMTSGISDEDGSIMLKLMVVVSVDTVTVMDIKFINVHEDNSAAKNMKTDSSSKKSDYYMEKEASDVICISYNHPQRGLRRSLPGTEHESMNKKGLQLYAIFFASVWCIKGNSCKFLHEKDGVGCTSQVAKEDWATSGDFIDCKGAEVSFFQSRAIIHQFNEFCVKDVRDDNLDNNCPSRSQNKMTSGISDEDGSIMLKLMVVVSVDTVTVMDIKFINVHEDNSAAKNMKTDSSSKKSDYYMEKEASDVICISYNHPQRGLRRSLPGTEHESMNKKGLQLYAIFFASVWCIKGNSCKFLHEKDGVGCTSQVAKEDWATSGDFIDCKRSLIRTCGGEIHGLAQFRNDDNLLASKNSSKEHFQDLIISLVDHLQHPMSIRISTTPILLEKGPGIRLTYVSPPFGAEHGYNVKKSLNSSDPGYEGMLGKSWHEYCGYFNGMAPPNPTTVDEEGQTDISSNTRKVDKGEDIKESKAEKIFHTALVDFVKQLLKTIWKEGHSSRDAHKMIVKKAAEKVINALQPHHVPIDRVDKGSSFGIQAKALEGYGGLCKIINPGPSISVGLQFCTQISAHGSNLNVWWAYLKLLCKKFSKIIGVQSSQLNHLGVLHRQQQQCKIDEDGFQKSALGSEQPNIVTNSSNAAACKPPVVS